MRNDISHSSSQSCLIGTDPAGWNPAGRKIPARYFAPFANVSGSLPNLSTPRQQIAATAYVMDGAEIYTGAHAGCGKCRFLRGCQTKKTFP